MMRILRFVVAVALTLAPTVALAQTTVRVTVDKATLWRAGFSTLVTVVGENQVLEVVGRQGDWIEVVVPANSSQERRTALISIRQVTVVSGTLPADGTTSAATPGTRPGGLQPLPDPGQRPGFGAPPPAGQPPIGQSARPAPPRPPLDTGLRGFGDVSYHFFTANDTFDAVLGLPGGPFFGGGVEYRFPNGLFVQGAARWFKKTGERVFVLDDEVFPLGIQDEVTITPVEFTGGWRFRSTGAIPYIGGGAGLYQFKETSEFEDPLEKVDEQFTSYHIVAGAEFRGRGWIAAAVEVQYTMVPDSLHGGLADIFDEHDLGGFHVRFKIVIGR
jgi:hypothetical protein